VRDPHRRKKCHSSKGGVQGAAAVGRRGVGVGAGRGGNSRSRRCDARATRTHTRSHTHTCTYTHTHAQRGDRTCLWRAHAHLHARTHAHTHARTRTCKGAPERASGAHTGTQAHKQAGRHARTRTCNGAPERASGAPLRMRVRPYRTKYTSVASNGDQTKKMHGRINADTPPLFLLLLLHLTTSQLDPGSYQQTRPIYLPGSSHEEVRMLRPANVCG